MVSIAVREDVVIDTILHIRKIILREDLFINLLLNFAKFRVNILTVQHTLNPKIR